MKNSNEFRFFLDNDDIDEILTESFNFNYKEEEKNKIFKILDDNKLDIILVSGMIINIKDLFNEKNNIYVADIAKEDIGLIKSGKYKLMRDKNGKILPTLLKGGLDKSFVRLKELNLSNKLDSILISNFIFDIILINVFHKIKSLEESTNEIKQALNNDRYAEYKSSIDQLKQANKIIDSELFRNKVNSTTSQATNSKNKYMQQIETNIKYIERQNFFEIFIGKKRIEKANEIFENLLQIYRCFKVECLGYSLLNEKDAIKECINEFILFLEKTKLNKRNTLNRLNEILKTEEKQNKYIDNFLKQYDIMVDLKNNIDNNENIKIHKLIYGKGKIKNARRKQECTQM